MANFVPPDADWRRFSACFAGNMPEANRSALPRPKGEVLVGDFDSHLQHVAGLLPGTRSHYLRHATLFLKGGVQYGAVRYPEGDAASDH